MESSIYRVAAGKIPCASSQMKGVSPKKDVYPGFFPDIGLKAVLLTIPLRPALFRLAVPHWLQFPSQCWWSMETGWRWGKRPTTKSHQGQDSSGERLFPFHCPTNGLCSPTTSFAGSGHPSLVLPEFGERGGFNTTRGGEDISECRTETEQTWAVRAWTR